MFKLVANFHFNVTRLLLHVSIGVRLLSLMGLAALVALLLESSPEIDRIYAT